MNGEEIDFSVVVPSYMQGEFLNACFESILMQTGVRFEVLVYDAKSSDLSREVLESYRDRLDYIEIESDLGQAHAINKGMRRARGRFLCYLNSDDVLEEGALETVCRAFDENPKVGLLYGNANYIDKEGRVTFPYRSFPWDLERFLDECYICQPAAFWRREVLERLGEFDQGLNYSMDYDYWLRIAGAGMNIGYLKEYLAFSRDYPETKTRKGHHRIFWENFRILVRRVGYVPRHWISGYLYRILTVDPKPLSLLVPKSQQSRDIVGGILEKFSRLFARDIHMLTDKKYNKVI